MRQKLEVLLLCDYRPEGAATVCAHINALNHFSRHNVHVVSMFGDLPPSLDLRRFDVLIIHYSLVIAMDAYLSRLARLCIRQFHGLKAMFIQDEYRWVNDTIEAMRYLGIDVLFTCVPETEIEKVYPASKLPEVTKVNVLTGYVPDVLTQIEPIPYASRPLDVGYRTRRISAWFGDLGQEKWRIAARFAEDAKRFGLKVDLSYNEADRLYGSAWTNFIRSCRAVLGIESGANVFDFTGELQKTVEAYEADHPGTPYEVIRDRFLRGLDHQIRMNQISPRCFEAAALRTLMILYEGEYSGILKPWRHYVPLKKDHSNVAEVIAALRDESTWRRITDAAYHEVARNPAYSYQAFVNRVDDVLESRFTEDCGATATPYSPEEFSVLTQQHAGLQRPVRIGQVLTLRVHRLIHRYFLDMLPEYARARLKRSLVHIYRLVRHFVRMSLDIWRCCVFIGGLFADIVRSTLEGEDVVRDLSMLKMRGRWQHADYGMYNLLQELEILTQFQSYGGRTCASVGASPFELVWLKASKRLELRPVTVSSNHSDMDKTFLRDEFMKGGIETFAIVERDRWGMPPVDAPIQSDLPAFSRLVKYFPRRAWRILFEGAWGEVWVGSIQVPSDMPLPVTSGRQMAACDSLSH